MPWSEITPMSQRREFVEDASRQLYSIRELCARYHISRRVGYKWLDRFAAGGLPALADQSRRPHTSPHQLDATLAASRFVRGQPFMEFWRAFMDFVGARPEITDLSSAEEAEFERIYDLVYMGQPDPVSTDDSRVGLRGEAEIRKQLLQSSFAHPRSWLMDR